jgi:hypothetical protein
MRLEPALVVLSLATAFARVAIAGSSARLVYVRAPDVSTCPDEAELRRAVSARFGYDRSFAPCALRPPRARPPKRVADRVGARVLDPGVVSAA